MTRFPLRGDSLYTRAYALPVSRSSRRRHRRPRLSWVWSWAWLLAVGFSLVAALALSVPLGTAPSGSQNQLFFDTFSNGTLAPFTAYGGDWSVTSHSALANDFGQPTHLDRQFLSMPYAQPNTWIGATLTLKKVPTTQAWRAGLIVHALGTESPDKWAFVLRPHQIALLNENTQWVSSAPFTAKVGVAYHMEVLANGLTVDGMIWPKGQPRPRQWTLSAQFAPNRVASGTDVGLYAGNVNASFSKFTVLAPPPPVVVAPTKEAAVFPRGQAVVYRINVQNPSVRPRTVKVRYSLEGVTNDLKRKGQFYLQLNGSRPASHLVALSDLPNGLYRIGWTVANTTPPKTIITRVPSETLAVIPPAQGGRAAPLWGMNENLASLSGPGSQASLQEHFALMREQGIQLYRLQLPLPAPGERFDWTKYHEIVSAALRAHLRILGLITAPSPGPKHPLRTLKPRYLAFVRAVVRQYGQTAIHDWEVWNEPSTPYYWALGPAQYGHLLSQSVAAIHRIQPNAFVLGYAYHMNQEWPAIRHKPNGWAIHYYPGSAPPNNARFSLHDAVQSLNAFLARHHRSAPIWITETGWSTKQVSMMQQAQYLGQAAIDAAASHVKALFFFSQTYYGGGFGEEQPNLAPLPAYVSVSTVTRTLAGATRIGLPPSLGPTVHDASFQGPGGRQVLTLWSTSHSSLTLPTLPGVKVYTAMGDQLTSSGMIRLPLGPSPLYVIANGLDPGVLNQWLQSAPLSSVSPYRISLTVAQARQKSPMLHVSVLNLSNQVEQGHLNVKVAPGFSIKDAQVPLPAMAPGHVLHLNIPIRRVATAIRSNLTVNLQAETNSNRVAHFRTVVDIGAGHRPQAISFK